jgi:hypothetical protein
VAKSETHLFFLADDLGGVHAAFHRPLEEISPLQAMNRYFFIPFLDRSPSSDRTWAIFVARQLSPDSASSSSSGQAHVPVDTIGHHN